MDEVYEITYADAAVGTARMEKQGLYYRFSCRCRLPKDGFFRIHVICADKRADLGICVPVDGMFGTDKKIPIKMLGDGAWTFLLRPNEWVSEEMKTTAEPMKETIQEMLPEDHFVPVSEQEPFADLDKLESAIMEIRSGKPGIVLQKME